MPFFSAASVYLITTVAYQLTECGQIFTSQSLSITYTTESYKLSPVRRRPTICYQPVLISSETSTPFVQRRPPICRLGGVDCQTKRRRRRRRRRPDTRPKPALSADQRHQRDRSAILPDSHQLLYPGENRASHCDAASDAVWKINLCIILALRQTSLTVQTHAHDSHHSFVLPY